VLWKLTPTVSSNLSVCFAMSPVMRFFVPLVPLFLMCRAAGEEEEALSLLQTNVGFDDHAEVSPTHGAAVDRDLDSTLAGKGTPPRRRRSRRRRTRRRRAPPGGWSCNGIKINQFAGQTFTVTQKSTYNLLQTHLDVNDKAEVHRQLSALGVNDSEVHRNLDNTLENKDGGGSPIYTYAITVGGQVHQQTSDAGNYFLGSHSSYGDMVEYYTNGDKCGNTPRRCTTKYTVGAATELLSARETSRCVYEFNVQLAHTHCGLPMTPLDDLDTNNEDAEDEHANEVQDEENNVHECAKWCYSKKHKNKGWKSPSDPFKCGWFACSDCSECQ